MELYAKITDMRGWLTGLAAEKQRSGLASMAAAPLKGGSADFCKSVERLIKALKAGKTLFEMIEPDKDEAAS